MIQTLALKPTDRLLVFAPHPDDESVATGGLLQHALAVGTRVLVVFFTDGDNNPWAQRASELRLRIGPVQRAHFGVRRRGEVRAALLQLGLPLGDARFLGFPDQGITDLLLHGNEVAAAALVEALQEWQPTVLVAPSLLDLHPDHSALAVMTAFALPASGVGAGLRTLVRYVVHNPRLRSRRYEGSQVLPLSAAQRQRKRAAIACHRTQLVLRGSWLFSFASQDERYYVAESPSGLAQHPVRGLVLGGGALTVRLASGSRPRAFGSRSLCLLGQGPRPVRLVVELPDRGGPAAVRDPRTGRPVGEAEFIGARGRGDLVLPADLVPPDTPLFAKVEHRFGFFDEAGWKAVGAASAAAGPEAPTRAAD